MMKKLQMDDEEKRLKEKIDRLKEIERFIQNKCVTNFNMSDNQGQWKVKAAAIIHKSTNLRLFFCILNQNIE